MSRDRFDVLDRFSPLFDAPEPSFERFLRRRDRQRRNQRISAGAVGIAVFVVTIWTVATGGPFDRSQTPAVTGSPVPSHPPGVAVGLPPEGATPSLPKHGDLVLSVLFGPTQSDAGRFTLNLYEDGRMIWWRLGGGPDPSGPTGLTEQRLTREGVELVREEVISTGLFDRDRYLTGTYEYGLYYFGRVTVRSGDRFVHVAWGDVGSTQGAETVATQGQVQTLQRLDAQLEDPVSWLPAGAWEDQEIKAYVPSRYGICYRGPQRMGPNRILTLLPDAVANVLRTKGVRRAGYLASIGGGRLSEVWCADSALTIDEARALVGALEDAGARPWGLNGPELEYRYRPPGRSDAVGLDLSPHLPDEV